MSTELLAQVCLHNLRLQLEDMQKSRDVRSMEVAFAYLGELEGLLDDLKYKGVQSLVAQQLNPAIDGDKTNYKVYELLASFGLSKEQLLAVANADGLHELRKLRMLRLVLGLSLPEAQVALLESEKFH